MVIDMPRWQFLAILFLQTHVVASFVGLVITFAAGLTMVMAVLSEFGIWVPTGWWRVLAVTSAALSIVLMLLFFGFTKVLPVAVAAAMIWYTLSVTASEYGATAGAD